MRRKIAVSDPVRGGPVTKPRVVLPREFDAVPPRSLRKRRWLLRRLQVEMKLSIVPTRCR